MDHADDLSADLSVFADDYRSARQRFTGAVAVAVGDFDRHAHPTHRGPDGELLFMDVCRIGPRDARRVLVITSGAHGIEGFSGSAVQTAWLRSGIGARLPADCALLLVHAVNPWGFAHEQRVTEEGVDLNRNFVDFDRPLPANPGYAALHPALCVEHWVDAEIDAAFAAMDGFRLQHGEQAFSDAFNGGQHEHADGVFYGGTRPQWSNRVFREVLRWHVAPHAEHAALVDFHTGIGPYGEPFFVNFDAAGTAACARAQRWWGERAVNRAGSTHQAFARYSGLLIDAFAQELPRAQHTRTVVEFGTYERRRQQRAALSLMWLRRHPDAAPALADPVRRAYREAYHPSDPAWRRAALRSGLEICESALVGLAQEARG